MITQKTFEQSATLPDEWMVITTHEDLMIMKQKPTLGSFTLLSITDYANFHIWTNDRNEIKQIIWKFKRGSMVRLIGKNKIDYNEYDILDIINIPKESFLYVVPTNITKLE